MPLLSPIPPANRGKNRQKQTPAFDHYDYDGKIQENEKRSHHKSKSEVINGLCRVARKLAGGKVPQYIQEATPALSVHLWNGLTGERRCTLCTIPSRPHLQSKQQVLKKRMIEIGLFDSKDLT